MLPTPPRRGPISILRSLLGSEAAGGALLLVAAVAALALANSPAAGAYARVLAFHLGPLSVLHWINDALMPVFFLLIGLEIKREWLDGGLSRAADRRLPIVVALSGMVVPALIYLAVVGRTPGLERGWAIPAATDIAFAIGVLALLGRRVPASLKLFLLAVAIVDDLGAIVVIALAYTAGLNLVALAAGAAIFGVMLLLGRSGVCRLWPFLLLAVALWAAVLASGVHATVAGVLAALTIPIRRSPGAPDAPTSPLHRLEHAIQPVVAFGIVPLFGLANAGLSFGGMGPGQWLSPLPAGIAAGLFVGKQAGVLLSVALAHVLGFAPRPSEASWRQIYGAALLCGIGFTMSLFIGGLAFADPQLIAQVKLGVLAGSLLSGLAGYAVLRFGARREPRSAGLSPPARDR